jgi:hypothetical protein
MKDDNKVLKIVYTFFLGLLLAIFIGLGVNTFYPSPQAPDYPTSASIYGKEPSEQDIEEQREFETASRSHQENLKPYNRNVSIITLVAAVLLLAISVIFEKKIKVIADGVMLGGLFTLVYSIGRGIASEDSKYVFAAVTIGLAIVLYLGYHRFAKPEKNPKK